VVGWLKRGPTGIIASAVGDAKETVQCVLQDLASSASWQPSHQQHHQQEEEEEEARPDPAAALSALRSPSTVSWAEWMRVDARERERGAAQAPAKPREKLLSEGEMLRVAKGWSGSA